MENVFLNDLLNDSTEETKKSDIDFQDDNIFDMMSHFQLDNLNFKPYTKNYRIKLNNNSYLKFFQDELSLKYNGKGVTTTDYAVRNIKFK